MKVGPQELLDQWDEYYLRIREHLTGTKCPRQRKRRYRNKIKDGQSPALENCSQVSTVDRPPSSASQFISTLREEDNPLASMPTFVPPLSRSPDRPDYSTITSDPIQMIKCDDYQELMSDSTLTRTIYSWESRLLDSLRDFLSDKGYEQPPAGQTIKDILDTIGEELDQGIIAFRRCYSVTQISPISLTDDSLELARLLFKPNSRSPMPLPGPHVRSRLRTLCADPRVTTDLILKYLAVAAVFLWVFQEFDDDPHTKMANNFHEVFSLFEQRESCPANFSVAH
jgi:hypothetical protein